MVGRTAVREVKRGKAERQLPDDCPLDGLFFAPLYRAKCTVGAISARIGGDGYYISPASCKRSLARSTSRLPLAREGDRDDGGNLKMCNPPPGQEG